MAKQTFTTGQVLTAAQQNSLQANDFNQTVSVKTANYSLLAADKGTRIEFNTSGSVTCTVNSGQFDAGDTLIIQNRGAGTATITAGTATVNTSASLALSQYSAGTLYFVSDSAALFFGDAAGISASIVDAKGDLIVGTADNTVARLAVGTNGHTLVADSSVSPTGLKWAAPASGGKVLQVVSTTKTDTFSTTSTSFADVTGLSVSITPSSASNKILVLFNLSGTQDVGAQLAQARLMRDSTAISVGDAAGTRSQSTGDPISVANVVVGTTVAGSYLDNPATTSSLTYKFQVRTSGGTMYVNRTTDDSDSNNRSRTASTITVLEIGA